MPHNVNIKKLTRAIQMVYNILENNICWLSFKKIILGKASVYNVGNLGSIPGSGRSSGEGNGNPLQYYCLENPMDRVAWQATVHGVAKSRTQLSELTFTFHFLVHICNGIYVYSLIYSALKRDKIGSFVEMWMDLETVIQREGKSERENQILYINAYMWNLEKWYRWTYLHDRNRDTDTENRHSDTGGWWGGMN